MQAWDDFYGSDEYRDLDAISDECSSARLVAVERV
jgi:hypothetical protein